MEEQTKQNFDIFAWANHTARVKNDLSVEFFVVNKRYTTYFLPLGSELAPQVAPVFVLEILNEIEKGAGLGLEVRRYEESESENGVLLFSNRERVSNAQLILDQIENNRAQLGVLPAKVDGIGAGAAGQVEQTAPATQVDGCGHTRGQ